MAKNQVSEKVADYFRSYEFLNSNTEAIADALRPDVDPAADIWEWLDRNFYNHQSQAAKDMLHEYFMILQVDVANTIAYAVPEQFLADEVGVPLDEITPEWRDGAYEHVFNSLKEFDLDGIIKDFVMLQVDGLEEHFDKERNPSEY